MYWQSAPCKAISKKAPFCDLLVFVIRGVVVVIRERGVRFRYSHI